jgi:hypothetical protein
LFGFTSTNNFDARDLGRTFTTTRGPDAGGFADGVGGFADGVGAGAIAPEGTTLAEAAEYGDQPLRLWARTVNV